MQIGSILVKASGSVLAAAAAVPDAVRAADPNLPLYDVNTMETLLAGSLAPRRFAEETDQEVRPTSSELRFTAGIRRNRYQEPTRWGEAESRSPKARKLADRRLD